MIFLLAGLALFLGAHSISIVDPSIRTRAISQIGEPAWKGLFAVISLVGLSLIIVGYGEARQSADPIVLYQAPIWARHITLLVMVPVFVLLFAAYLPGRIQRTTKHPMLLAVKLWAIAHLLANGTLADLLLFGSFFVWAIADVVSLKRRTPPPVPGAPSGPYNDWIAIGGGLLLYAVFLLWLHRLWFGVAPIALG